MNPEFFPSHPDSEDINKVTFKIFVDSKAKRSAIALLEESGSQNNHDDRSLLQLYFTSLCYQIQIYVEQWTKDYIWHNENFNLAIMNDHDTDLIHLKGKTRFGDAIDDEWFIVFILYQISLEFPQVIISVIDNDGEFLLIEAADMLPKWMNGNTVMNRVFIHQGKLHTIPKQHTQLSLNKGLSLVSNPTLVTEASESIQLRIREKISGYPEKAFKEHNHRGKCTLPKRIAFCLARVPGLLSASINAFLESDPLSYKSIAHSPRFLIWSDDQVVTTTFEFTKLLYAQLISQRLPSLSIVSKVLDHLEPGSIEYLRCETGLKLTLGCEILVSDTRSGVSDKHDSTFSRSDLMEALNVLFGSKGPFREDALPLLHSRIRFNLKALEEHLKRETDDDSTWINNEEEDSLSWLNVDPKDLEEMLTKTVSCQESSFKSKKTKTAVEKNTSFDSKGELNANKLEQMANSFEKFLESESGYQGITLSEEDRDSSDQDRDSSDQESIHSTSSDIDSEHEILQAIHNDPDLLMKIIEKSQEHGMDYRDIIEKLKNMTIELDEKTCDDPQTISSGEERVECELSSDDEEMMEQYFGAMSQELESTLKKDSRKYSQFIVEEDENDPTLNMRANLLQNLMGSFEAQQGLPGPSSTILSSMGIFLPRNEEETPKNNIDASSV